MSKSDDQTLKLSKDSLRKLLNECIEDEEEEKSFLGWAKIEEELEALYRIVRGQPKKEE